MLFPFSHLFSRVYAILGREQTKTRERTGCNKWAHPHGALWQHGPREISDLAFLWLAQDGRAWKGHWVPEQTWRENDKEHTLCQERHCCVRMQQRLMTGHVVLHRCRWEKALTLALEWVHMCMLWVSEDFFALLANRACATESLPKGHGGICAHQQASSNCLLLSCLKIVQK